MNSLDDYRYHSRIMAFIELQRSCVPNAVEVFTRGNCGCFARLLLMAFRNGKIMQYQQSHFLFDMGHNIYDITGVVNEKYPYEELRELKGNINDIIDSLKPRYATDSNSIRDGIV